MKIKKRIIVFAIIAIGAIIAAILYFGNKEFEYNDEGATGNTAGNLYNQGLFCEYGGDVYFANSSDKNMLYKMNMDGTEFEKVYDDSASYINICNDYIYYKKNNSEKNKDNLFTRTLYGIVRYGIEDSDAQVLHAGKIDCMTLCGNYIYYRYYDDESLFSLRKVKIDGEDDVLIDTEDYAPIAVYKDEIYFSNVSGNHNLYVLNTKNDAIRTVAAGNFYMPDMYGGELYFIDLDNDRALTKMNLSTMEKTILSQDKVINYNLSGIYGVIFYQAENSADDHKLCRISLGSMENDEILKGDYSKINITKKYTYFYHTIGGLEILYRTPTLGEGETRTFTPPALED